MYNVHVCLLFFWLNIFLLFPHYIHALFYYCCFVRTLLKIAEKIPLEIYMYFFTLDNLAYNNITYKSIPARTCIKCEKLLERLDLLSLAK